MADIEAVDERDPLLRESLAEIQAILRERRQRPLKCILGFGLGCLVFLLVMVILGVVGVICVELGGVLLFIGGVRGCEPVLDFRFEYQYCFGIQLSFGFIILFFLVVAVFLAIVVCRKIKECIFRRLDERSSPQTLHST